MKNLYYFKVISPIGGVEQFLYEMAKRYGDYDLCIIYDQADQKQLERLEKTVRCIKRDPKKTYECEKFFANFNLDMIGQVIAKRYYFVVHANFDELGYHPNLMPLEKLPVTYVAVSKFAAEEFTKFTGKPCEVCYNPLTIEPREEVLHLVSACRLNDRVKGGERTLKLMNALDRYCITHNRHYLWTIFTNETHLDLSPNVVLMKRRVDVRPYIQDADYCLQLSNDMETYCYTLNEAWCYGVHTVSTPLSVLKELPVPEEANMVLDWDCSNADEIARRMFEDKRKPFDYVPPEDRWTDYLAEGESEYKKEMAMRYRVKALKAFEKITDNEAGRPRAEGEEWTVDRRRLDTLVSHGLVENLGEEIEDGKLEPRQIRKAIRKSAKSVR